MLTVEQINEKWAPMINAEDVPKIEDNYRQKVVAKLMENQESVTRIERGDLPLGLVVEAAGDPGNPTNVTPTGVGAANTSAIKTWDPVLISMVRRAVPVSIGFDIWGVQPMSGPTGLIFAMKSKYDTPAGAEALFAEADTEHSGAAAIGGGTPDSGLTTPFHANYGVGIGMLTATGEALGTTDGGNFNEMGFEITKKSVEARTRALKATWSVELQQDLQAVHGLSAENELANILSTEVTAELDREMIRRAYIMAPLGAQADTATQGTFDLDTDSNGRWSVERFKGLMFQIERDANAIALSTRRGKGNFMITSADVASALAMTGLLEANPTTVSPGSVNPASSSYVG
ncbi:MAG: ATP-binding protein, partial [Deltaproteobacteria bacterium]